MTIAGSVVRVDLMSYSVTERDANNQPVLAFRQRLIFPVAAFANSVELMQKALAGLVEAGTVRRAADLQAVRTEPVAEGTADTDRRGAAPPVARRNASSNFP
ncbi:hypothetical protein Asru_0063_09 [Acidisphaera rubrifaciens HS-AP3]|uniref:Uncharacterized protein n=1 Tax=Acidisphaera rubrifaciens HS-AP3 TaxID=1231350 RepID=A0A0D6P3C6_9PROT|nr:hypothetical protein Asru_0063_09 [Acidisphaera rubrifaciens HS-AP3]